MTPAEHIAAAAEKPYSPGNHDCVTFIAAWADHVSGSSHLACLEKTYVTKWEGMSRHKATSGICEAIARTLTAAGWALVQKGDLQEGDIVLTNLDHPGIYHASRIHAQPLGCTGTLAFHPRHAKGGLRWQR